MTSEDRARALLKVFDKGINFNEFLNYLPGEYSGDLLMCLIIGNPLTICDPVLEALRDCIIDEMELEDERKKEVKNIL